MVRIASRVLRDARLQWRRLIQDERGSIIVLAIWLPVLAGAVAIGVETGELYRIKRQMQSAADAAALAGAIDSMASRTSSITTDAKYEAQRNGFTDNGDTVKVTINTPPLTGPNVSTNNAVEAIVQKKVGAGLLGSLGTFTLTARSVAAPSTYTTTGTPSAEGCLVAMTTANEQGVSFTNFSSFTSDCTIVSNGSAKGSGTSASVNVSNFSSATLKQVWTRGSVTVQNYSSITYRDAANHGTAPLINQSSYATDPYASIGAMALPSGTGNCDYNNFSAGNASTVTVNANKIYCNGLQVSNASTVNFTPGIYYIAGGDLYISSVSTVSCPTCSSTNGVAFVLTQLGSATTDQGIGGVSISSDSTINLNAGSNNTAYRGQTFNGILFYQDPRVNVGTMGSTSKIFTVSSLSNATLSGAIYFPNNRIDISNISTFGGSATTGCTIWLGRYIKFSNFSSTYKGGCANYGTQPVTITSTTTVTKGKVLE